MPVLIIGCGNADRGDDAAGLLVARRLRQLGVEAVELCAEPLALIDTWAGASHVILVDAVVSGAPPGRIFMWDVRHEPIAAGFVSGSTHAFGVAEAVELARALDLLPLSLVIYGIEGASFDFGAAPSPEVEKAVEEVARRIAALPVITRTN